MVASYIKMEEDKWTQHFYNILFHKSKNLLTSSMRINVLLIFDVVCLTNME